MPSYADETRELTRALSYRAAQRGRTTADWNPAVSSADRALIPAARSLTARSRDAVRNNIIIRAASRAFRRNVVGRGIEVVPTAKSAAGQEMTELNNAVAKAWAEWCSRPERCDVTGRRTFWEMQRLAVDEMFATGNSLFIWSATASSGFRLQACEFEQLDQGRDGGYDRAGSEIRNGIEVDIYGKATGYWLFDRNPGDYHAPTRIESHRVDAGRVIHVMTADRVLQTIGESRLAAVLLDARDSMAFKDATLMRARMEACIGFIIKKSRGITNPAFPAAAGDSGQTSSGIDTFDIMPGMIPRLAADEDVEPFIPSAPGGQYEMFIKTTVRLIAAAMGMSYDMVARNPDGNYSAARQSMLEDQREVEPEQDSLVDHFVLPTYEQWYRWMVLSGKLPVDVLDYQQNPDRYHEAQYVFPARPWIDPEKEANGYAKLIEQRLASRGEILAAMGRRTRTVFDMIADERKMATALGISLPESQNEQIATYKQDVVKAFMADGSVADVIANQTDIKALVRDTGLPVNEKYTEPYLPVQDTQGRTVTGELIKDGDGDVVGAVVKSDSPMVQSVEAANEAAGDSPKTPTEPASNPKQSDA